MLPARPGVVRLLLICLLLPLLAACREQAKGGPASDRRFYTSEDLRDLVLRRDEAPEDTEFLRDGSGRFSLRRFWPSACCLGIQDQFDEAGFQTARVALFERPGHSADPIDTRPGWELVSSAAVLFLTEEGAATALDVWVDHYRGPVLEPVETRGLGEQAVGLTGSPEAPAERIYLYVWRRGRLLLGLRASTGAGTVPVEVVRRLVDRMDLRAS